ncbi:MAG: universal stress protein [Pseudomonadota bacterium]
MFNTLLLAVDVNDPDGATRCTEAAIATAQHEGATLHILNVVPDDGMSIVSAALSSDHASDVVSAHEKALRDWATTHVPASVETQIHIARGTVYDQIIKTASELNVDGIFVGAHSPAFKDYLIGPNAARVARHAKQSVFVIR